MAMRLVPAAGAAAGAATACRNCIGTAIHHLNHLEIKVDNAHVITSFLLPLVVLFL